MKSIARTRIEKELKMFSSSPTPGISCTCNENSLQNLVGVIIGAPGTPFENGLFTLSIQIPDRYPFEPPCLRFVTPIYHPNIDSKGRICLDTLKLPPQGTWKPHLNLSTVLTMIRVLIGEPGTEDPLMADIWQEYKYDYPTYVEKARQWTNKYARSQMSCSDQVSEDVASSEDDDNESDEKNPGQIAYPHSVDVPDKAESSEERTTTTTDTTASSSALHDGTNLQDLPRKRGLGLKTSRKPDKEISLNEETDVKKSKIQGISH